MKKQQLNWVIIPVLVITAITFLFFNWPANKDAADKVVRFGTGGKAVDYGPYIVAKSHGWFATAMSKHGYKVAHTEFDSPPTINESFETGRVDAVFVAVPPVLVGKSAGIDIRIVGVSSSLVQDILVPTDSSLDTIQGLKGKKIAVLKGSSSHYGLYKIIKNAGLSPADIEVFDMLPPDARNAFETGSVDAWAVWPPWVEQLEVADKGRTLSGGGVKIFSILAARGQFVDENPKLVKEMLDVLANAKQWIISHPKEAKKIIAEELGVSNKVIDRAWPRHNFLAKMTDKIVLDIQARSDFLYDNKIIKEKVDVQRGFIQRLFDDACKMKPKPLGCPA